jgi:hypothetical protein
MLSKPFTSTCFDQNIPFSPLFSDTLNLSSSVSVRQQVSYQFKKDIDMIIVLLTLRLVSGTQQILNSTAVKIPEFNSLK